MGLDAAPVFPPDGPETELETEPGAVCDRDSVSETELSVGFLTNKGDEGGRTGFGARCSSFCDTYGTGGICPLGFEATGE